MPYGGTLFSTVGADLVQADVDAIVQGVAGSPGKTLADVQAPLAGVLECLLGNRPGVLTELGGQLGDGLFDTATGSPLLQMLGENLHGYLFNPLSSMPWMEMLSLNLDYFLNDSMAYQPWLQTINSTIGWLFEAYLNDGMRGQTWMATLDQEIQSGFSYHLFDQNAYQPFLQTIKYDLQSYLFNPMLNSSWLESLNNTTSTGLFDGIGEPWFASIRSSLDNYLYDWQLQVPWLETLHEDLSALRAVLEDVHDPVQHALRTV